MLGGSYEAGLGKVLSVAWRSKLVGFYIAGEENTRLSCSKQLKIQTMRLLNCFLDIPTLQEYIYSFIFYNR